MLNNFNGRSQAGGYIYRRNPVHAGSFTLLRPEGEAGELEPVGSYIVLDKDENPALSEKKLINLVTVLNGGDDMIDLSHETKSRVYYHQLHSDGPLNEKKIMFYALGPLGVSRENALLTLKEKDDGRFEYQDA